MLKMLGFNEDDIGWILEKQTERYENHLTYTNFSRVRYQEMQREKQKLRKSERKITLKRKRDSSTSVR
jgi:hypothetical protein